ncbi:hypothetical protein [Methanobrevibacter sp.]|uniref:hypothetical protein n=1 Tax=Methanobrevibacter sp. TaxID=66852 RepID=UPI00386DCC64
MDSGKIKIAVAVVIVLAIGAFIFVQANSHNTKIDVTSNSTLMNGDYLTLVLKDEFRNVYPGEVINVKILDDSGWASYYNGTTDETGTVRILLEGMENGNYTVHSTFNGTMFLHQSKSVTNLEMNDGMN